MNAIASRAIPLEPSPDTRLEDELDRLRALLDGGPEAPAPQRRWPPLAGLATRLGLDEFATDLVLLLLAVEVTPDIADRLAAARDDRHRRWPTLALAQTLFGGDAATARSCLLPSAALMRLRVVAIDEAGPAPLPWRGLRLEEPVLAWLLGRAGADPLLMPAWLPLPPPLLLPEDACEAEALAHRLGSVRPVPRLRLTGPPRSGRRALASAVAARLGLSLVELDLDMLRTVAGGDAAVLALLARDAALLDLGWLVDESALDRNDRAATAFVQLLRRALEAFLVLLDRPGAPGVDGAIAVDLRAPAPARRIAIWKSALPGRDDVDADFLRTLVGELDLGPREVALAVRDAGPAAAPAELRRAARARAAFAVDGLAERVVPMVRLDELVLPADTAAHLREIVAALRARALVEGEWAMVAGERGRGVAALFSGPSGTGKTTAAEAIAAELDLDLWRIDLATTVSKWIGETEKNLKWIFDAAETGGAILFFDEADALFGKRSEVKDSSDRWANIEIDYLLQRMERHPGLAILATNRRGDLDPAFLRRLRHLVPFPFPNAGLRRELWAQAFPRTTPTAHLDLDALSGLELSGGSIRNVALNAASLAAARGGPVEMDDVLHAARREYAKLERLPQGMRAGERR
ncbi:ATPase central domain-containing protein [Caballeronia peredens]|nr:ATPase central domain-containing protein [Caballeronia peredens]